jgi:hypothetical protein
MISRVVTHLLQGAKHRLHAVEPLGWREAQILFDLGHVHTGVDQTQDPLVPGLDVLRFVGLGVHTASLAVAHARFHDAGESAQRTGLRGRLMP